MSTHPIGIGTVNVTVNMPQELRQTIGRQAYLEDRSTGQLIRRAVSEYLERVREAAPHIAGTAAVILFGLGFGAAIAYAMTGGSDMRLSGRPVRAGRRWEEVA